MKRNLHFAIVLILFFTSCMMKKEKNADFIRVEGSRFFINDHPYYFLGANVWFGANLGSVTAGGERQRLIRELDKLKNLGINNLRILGASEGTTYFNTVYPPIQPDPGNYDEKVLAGLDFLLAEMSKREMYAVIFLNNYWVWSGGMAQYVCWVENEPMPNPFLEQYSWDEFMKFSARFYDNEDANKIFYDYIKMLVNRKNRFTGRIYKDDPTIMAWQLANEPRPGAGDWGTANFEVFQQWVEKTAAYLKSLDPYHLVSTGNEGLGGTMWSQVLYENIHRCKDIDYMTVHLWVLNWGWFDPLKAAKTFPVAEKNARDYLNNHIRMAQQIGKPLVLEEFGIPRDLHSFNPESTTEYRDIFFRHIFTTIFNNAREGGPFAGSNFWSWAGEGKPSTSGSAQWQEGDPFTGDPPQEPQGRNSVFNTDHSTLQIIKEYASLMNALSAR